MQRAKGRFGHFFRLCKLAPLIITIIVINKLKGFFVQLEGQECSDSVTNYTIQFLAKTLPQVMNSNFTTLAMDVIQLLMAIATTLFGGKVSNTPHGGRKASLQKLKKRHTQTNPYLSSLLTHLYCLHSPKQKKNKAQLGKVAPEPAPPVPTVPTPPPTPPPQPGFPPSQPQQYYPQQPYYPGAPQVGHTHGE